MDCKQFRGYIPQFLDDGLTTEIMEEFIAHEAECKECAEELEIMHLLEVSLSQIDGDVKAESFDFNGILKNKLVIAGKHCRAVRTFEKVRKSVVLAANIISAFGIAYQLFAIFGGKEWMANYF